MQARRLPSGTRSRRIWSAFFKALSCLALIVAVYFLMAWLLCLVRVNNDFVEPRDGVKIFVCGGGLHCDLIVPAKNPSVNWFERLPATDFENVATIFPYVAFGFGDRRFYMETPHLSDLKLSTALQALSGLGTPAMHVEFLPEEPASGGACRKITISSCQNEKLVSFITESFNGGRFVRIVHKGYGATDAFYEARGNYNLLYTCNVWTGRALSAAGVRVGCWTPFDWGVMNSLK